MYVCLSVCLPACLPARPSVRPSVCLCVCMSVCLCLSVCLSVCMYVCMCMYVFKAMMFNACLFEIISYLTLRSSRVGSGIAQRREGHLSFAVSHKRCYVWCCAGHIEVYRSGIFQLHSIVDFSFGCWIERDLGISQGSASLPILRLVAERLVDRSSRDLAPRSLRTRTRR